MRVLTKNDFAEVTLRSLVADYDHETVVTLYQPIVGYKAIAVYFTLLHEAKNEKVYSLITHEEILMKMQITSGEFVEARKSLEALGLLKTYYRKECDSVIYHYEIYAPRTPGQFFENTLLYGMLIKCLGENIVKKIRLLYVSSEPSDFGDDITSKFTEVYHPSYDDKAFTSALNDNKKSKGRNTSKINGVFSYEIFFKNLGEVSQIKPESIEKKEIKEIERLATLYGVDEMSAANYVSSLYDPYQPKGKHIDFKALASMFQKESDFTYTARKANPSTPNLISSDSDLASKINFMETVSPKKFLSTLQNGTTPAAADLRLIDDLSKNFNLNNAVLNVLIEYCLVNCENVLSRTYAEKVAASLAREGVTTAIDAMNYLLKSKKVNRKIASKSEDEPKKVSISNNDNKENKKTNDEPSWDELLDEIDQGGSDGKA